MIYPMVIEDNAVTPDRDFDDATLGNLEKSSIRPAVFEKAAAK